VYILYTTGYTRPSRGEVCIPDSFRLWDIDALEERERGWTGRQGKKGKRKDKEGDRKERKVGIPLFE